MCAKDLLNLIFIVIIINFWPYSATCQILVPRPETEPMPPVVETLNLNR